MCVRVGGSAFAQTVRCSGVCMYRVIRNARYPWSLNTGFDIIVRSDPNTGMRSVEATVSTKWSIHDMKCGVVFRDMYNAACV